MALEASAAVPPPGLSGPTSFSFSPPSHDDGPFFTDTHRHTHDNFAYGNTTGVGLGGRYLTFLSGSHWPQSNGVSSGGSTSSDAGGTTTTSSERKFCVIDLEPFLRGLVQEEKAFHAELDTYRQRDDNDRERLDEIEGGQVYINTQSGDSRSSAQWNGRRMPNVRRTAHRRRRDEFDDGQAGTSEYDDESELECAEVETTSNENGVVTVTTGTSHLSTPSTALPSTVSFHSKNTNTTQEPKSVDDLPIADPRIVTRRFVHPLLNYHSSAAASSSTSSSSQKLGKWGYGRSSPFVSSRRGQNNHGRASSSSSTSRGIESDADSPISLEERLRRERQRLHSSGITQFSWSTFEKSKHLRAGANKGVSDIAVAAAVAAAASAPITATSPDTPRINMRGDRTRRPSPERVPVSSKGRVSSGCVDPPSLGLRILVPLRGNVYVQDGVGHQAGSLRPLYEKSMLDRNVIRTRAGDDVGADKQDRTWSAEKRSRSGRDAAARGRNAVSPSPLSSGSVVGRDAGAIDPQLSPDGKMLAFVVAGEIYVMSCGDNSNNNKSSSTVIQTSSENAMEVETSSQTTAKSAFAGGAKTPIRITFGASSDLDEWDSEEDEDDDDEYDDGFDDDVESTAVTSRDDRTESSENDEMDISRRETRTSAQSLASAGRRRRRRQRLRRSRRRRKIERDPDRCVSHGLADFVAQEEMERYRGFWWDTTSTGILFARVDETRVPPYRITHQGRDAPAGDDSTYEDHRYPFAGEENPEVTLGYVRIDRSTMLGQPETESFFCGSREEAEGDIEVFMEDEANDEIIAQTKSSPQVSLSQRQQKGTWRGRSPQKSYQSPEEAADAVARYNWSNVRWFDPPTDASEYLARVSWLPDGAAAVQWEDRSQSTLMLVRTDIRTGETNTLLVEKSDYWINLHHMFRLLPRPIHPDECRQRSRPVQRQKVSSHFKLPNGSFSFLFASERTGYSHIYLYTYVPGDQKATLIRAISAGEWVVESIAGVDMENDVVYITGTYDSPLERHLYALPLINPWIRVAADSIGSDIASQEGSSGGGSGMAVRRGFKQVMSTLSGAAISKTHRPFRRKTDSSGGVAAAVFGLGTSEPNTEDIPTPEPMRLTKDPGMHSIVMDDACRLLVDTSSDLGRPTSSRVYALPVGGPFRSSIPVGSTRLPERIDDGRSSRSQNESVSIDISRTLLSSRGLKLLFVPYDSSFDEKLKTSSSFGRKNSNGSSQSGSSRSSNNYGFPPPELLSFPTSDGTEMLHAALYRPDALVHGPGPYPLICAVYGGPHVQRVNRSWSQCADMRAQRLCSLGFAVLKCDNRGSARRGLVFEGAIQRRLGRMEVLDQVTAVRQLAMRGIADSNRVGIYGWSYGGYLAIMCLCRAPDVFHVAVAGAPVTSWDGYDTHYTERYMGLPSNNPLGYEESAVFEHIPNMRGKMMLVHGLIDENVHFRHTARLINRLIAAGKDYDLLIFPDERHSPRRLRDRIYMEKRISDYFVRHLLGEGGGSRVATNSQHGSGDGGSSGGNSLGFVRAMAGHL